MNDAAKMFELQKVDITWVKVARRLQQLQQKLGESDDVGEARRKVTETESALHDWRAKQHDAELASQRLGERIDEAEQLLMSGKVNNPKELEGLQANVDALKRQRVTVDEQAVEAMMQADEAAGQLEGEQAQLAELEKNWEGEQGELRQEETKLKQHYVRLKRKRESMVSELDENLRKRYETMRKRKAGVAIAQVEGDICGACNVQIPTGVVSSLRGSNGELTICPSCGRYLYAS